MIDATNAQRCGGRDGEGIVMGIRMEIVMGIGMGIVMGMWRG